MKIWIGLAAATAGVAVTVGALWTTDFDVIPSVPEAKSVTPQFGRESGAATSSASGGSGRRLLSADPQGALATKAPDVVPSLSVFHAPASSREVSDLLGAYWARNAELLLNAADLLYQEEQRDESWADPLELKFRSDINVVGSVALVSGECRASLCRYSVRIVGAEPIETILAFGQQFRREPTSAQLYYRPEDSGSDRLTMYLFSLDPGSRYLRPLHEMLDPLPAAAR